MTDEECIALAMLHGPSTRCNATGVVDFDRYDPLRKDDDNHWWVYRDNLCQPDFRTAGAAARHYCKHYGLLQE